MSVRPRVGRHRRLLDILEQLESGSPLSANQLARQCRVSRRTVFRDIDLLRDAGVPVRFDRESHGYRIQRPDAAIQLPSFGSHELTVLIAAIHFSMLQHFPGFRDQLHNATTKLLSACSFHLRQSVTRLTGACLVAGVGQIKADRTERTVTSILHAIGQRRVLDTVIAQRSGELIQTELAPYRIIAAPATWQVVGQSTYHGTVRTFDSCRIVRAELTDNAYALPRKYERAG